MWSVFGWKGPSGFSGRSTAEQVTQGIDGTGLTAIVTGASNGIGVETSRTLAMRDLSSMASVRKFASEYISSGLPLNILINNAGIAFVPFTLSKDNVELHFATNYLGHFLLTDLLVETMKNTARESNQEGRIVNVSSAGHPPVYPGEIRFDHNDQSTYNLIYAYGQSKLANVLHANELSRRLKEDGVAITANSVNPGGIRTNIVHHLRFLYAFQSLMDKLNLLKNCEQGAATTCYVALHPQVKGSKLANVLHANELSRRLKEDGVAITANSVNPGGIRTNIVHHLRFLYAFQSLMDKLNLLKNCEQGAATTCYVALHPQVKGL
ncbi:NAD(P)-binding Rossmann-fold superfamily protein [Euphorbia peplus]|nr:NAD(P)-binding Rossmann-fold superfamily protein [Euphorbia peplus]